MNTNSRHGGIPPALLICVLVLVAVLCFFGFPGGERHFFSWGPLAPRTAPSVQIVFCRVAQGTFLGLVNSDEKWQIDCATYNLSSQFKEVRC